MIEEESYVIEIMEQINQLLDQPIDLNSRELKTLHELQLISLSEWQQIQNHIKTHGKFISIYELQNVDGLSFASIERIRFLVKVAEKRDKENIFQKIRNSNSTVFIRWAQILENKKGYEKDSMGKSFYQGNPQQYYLRYQGRYSNKLSFGFTGEKDPGETFFRKNNSLGFDFYSFHLMLRSKDSKIKKMILGDYHYRMGQGLILNTSFSTGKGSTLSNIKSAGIKLRPHTSLAESIFFRGMAIQVQLNQSFSLDFALSKNSLDVSQDSSRSSFSSIQISGLHRSQSEIQNKNSTNLKTAMATLAFQRGRNRIQLNTLYYNLPIPFAPDQQLYKTFFLRGKSLLNASLDYTVQYKNIHLFGEVALSDQLSIAQLHGALIGLDKNIGLGFLWRDFSESFHTFHSKVFSESGQSQNERGFYFGIEVKPMKNILLVAYADFWQHPWLKFNVDSPSYGFEHFMKLSYRKKRKFDIYLQYKFELKEKNISSKIRQETELIDFKRKNFRFHISHKLNKEIEIRNRLELSFSQFNNTKESGFMFFQDLIYKPIERPLSFTARIAYFDVSGYNARIYAYENDILGSFSIPAFSGQGYRYYLNFRYKPLHDITLDLRWAQSIFFESKQIGTGAETIEGNTRSQLKMQLKYKF